MVNSILMQYSSYCLPRRKISMFITLYENTEVVWIYFHLSTLCNLSDICPHTLLVGAFWYMGVANLLEESINTHGILLVAKIRRMNIISTQVSMDWRCGTKFDVSTQIVVPLSAKFTAAAGNARFDCNTVTLEWKILGPWRHDIETLNALLALCEWNPSVARVHKWRVMWIFCALYVVSLNILKPSCRWFEAPLMIRTLYDWTRTYLRLPAKKIDGSFWWDNYVIVTLFVMIAIYCNIYIGLSMVISTGYHDVYLLWDV